MKRADEVETQDPDVRVALSYFTLLMKRDLDAFEKIWHEDAIQEIPFVPEGLGTFVADAFRGIGEIMDHYRTAFANRRDHIFWIDELFETTSEGCIVIEAHARSLVGETQRVYENKYVCIFQMRDGRIALLKEYVNPLAATKAFQGGFN